MILSWCCFNLGWKRVGDGHLHWKYGYIQDRQAPSTCLRCLSLSPGGQRLKLSQRLRERNTVLFQLQQCQTKQTDGALQKKHSTTREPLHRPPVTATGLLCRPQNTPHDPCKSLRSRGNSQSEPQPGPGSASATLGGNDVQRQKHTSTPRTCISAFGQRAFSAHSTVPFHAVPRRNSMQCHPIASICRPLHDRPSTGQVPEVDRSRRPLPALDVLHSSSMPRLLPRKPYSRTPHDNGHEQGHTAMLVNTV